jgi:hypothetical protein
MTQERLSGLAILSPYLFIIYRCFNDTVSSSDYTVQGSRALSDWMTVNNSQKECASACTPSRN